MTLLIINLCKHDLHYFEFVKPIEDIAGRMKMKYKAILLKDLKSSDLQRSGRIIICGTSLQDFDYLDHDFSWIKNYEKSILGICAGMQVICREFGCNLSNAEDIGLKEAEFHNFLGIDGKRQVYCLHNRIVRHDVAFRKTFDILGDSGYVQAAKHKHKDIFTVLFHPEARNKDIIENFLYRSSRD